MDLFCRTCSNTIPHVYAMGYIDPGAGYVFSSALPIVFGFVATFFTAAFAFLMRRKKLVLLAIVALVIGTIGVMSYSSVKKSAPGSRVIILGFDGMDPKILSQAIEKGYMPNIQALKKMGYYSELQTTTPPQSPVAWASFATGTDPAKHGVFDFIVRNPKTYQLDLVWMENITSAIRSEPFWQTALKKDIDSTVLFLPNTFPPSKLQGKMISGMGTPDILGTAGKFTFFTTETLNEKSRGNQVSIDNIDEQTASLPGPKYQDFGGKKTASIPLTIMRDQKNKKLTISIQNKKITLKEGEFSGWIPLEFKIDFLTRINGIAKLYVKKVSPEIELYMSPINFDPARPIKDISYPKSYAKDLAKEYGSFYTQGLPHDTWALEEGIFDDKAFLENANSILSERETIYFGELAKQKSGILFSYFGITDTASHMYWNTPEVILGYYKKMDDVVGKTLKQMEKQDTLIILSDHGFAGFDWDFNLNTWLKEKGYLVLKDGANTGGPLLEGIDWQKTKAYAVGYNGIYLNIKGREKEGVVEQNDVKALEESLKQELLSAENLFDGSKVFKNIYTKESLQIKSDDSNSPDLFVGYFKGIRSSWDTAVGATPESTVVKREGKWAGDHLFDASEVPGILISNRDLKLKQPQITQIMPYVLNLLTHEKTK